MALISEDVKTVIACQTLNAQSVNAEELITTSIVSDVVATNLLTLVDPNDITKTGTLEEVGTTLQITSPNVQIDGNVIVTGTLTLPINPPNANGYYDGTVVINDGVKINTLVFKTGLLFSYTQV